MSARRLPGWKAGAPPTPGLYFAFSTAPERTDAPGLYAWNGEQFQHVSGWYDNAITHWMATDFPRPARLTFSSAEQTADDASGTNTGPKS